MLDVDAIVDADLKGLSPEAIATLAQRMLGQLREQRQHLQQRDERIAQQASEIAQKASAIEQQASELERKDAELRFKTAKLEKVNFELARLKAWKFGARTEAMSAEQRRLFEETLAEDEASLKALLEQLQGKLWRVNPDARGATIWMRTVSRRVDDAAHLIVAGAIHAGGWLSPDLRALQWRSLRAHTHTSTSRRLQGADRDPRVPIRARGAIYAGD